MAYCTVDEIKEEFKSLAISTTTMVKEDQVSAFILEADALINSYIGSRYNTPILGSKLLKLYSRTLVADRIRKILETKNVNPNEKGNQNVRGFTSLDVMRELEKIKNGSLNLDAGTLLDTNNGFYSSNYQNGVEPFFKKDEKQW